MNAFTKLINSNSVRSAKEVKRDSDLSVVYYYIQSIASHPRSQYYSTQCQQWELLFWRCVYVVESVRSSHTLQLVSNFGRTTTTTGGVRPHCVRVRCGVRAALGKLRLRARKRALAFDVSPTPQKHGGKMFRDTFSKVHSSLKRCFARSLLDKIWGYFQQFLS